MKSAEALSMVAMGLGDRVHELKKENARYRAALEEAKNKLASDGVCTICSTTMAVGEGAIVDGQWHKVDCPITIIDRALKGERND